MKMQFLALGWKWGARAETPVTVESASAASKPSAWNNEAKASPPRPLALLARKSRRVSLMMSSGLTSVAGDEFVQIRDDADGSHEAGLAHGAGGQVRFRVE